MTAERIVVYLPLLVERLMAVLLSSPSVRTKEGATVVLALAAGPAGEHFFPYAPKVLEAMQHLMQQTADEYLALRGAATDCVGAIAKAIGHGAFAPYLDSFVQLALQGMQLDYHGVRSNAFRFFDNLARSMEMAFAPLLPQVLELCTESCETEGLTAQMDTPMDALDALDPEEYDEDVRRIHSMQVPTGLLDEQLAAATCLKACAESCACPAFVSAIPAVAELCEDRLVGYFAAEIRQVALELLVACVKALHAAHPPAWAGGAWAPGLPPQSPLAAEVAPLCSQVAGLLVERLAEDDDKDVVAAAADEITELVTACGPAAIADTFDTCLAAAAQMLQQELPCQADEEFGLGDEDAALQDASLMESFSSLFGALARARGPAFEPLFRPLYPKVLALIQPTTSTGMRGAALGAVAEVLQRITGEAVAEYVAAGVVPVLAAAAEDDFTLKSNAIYTLGIFAEVAPAAVLARLGELVTAVLQAAAAVVEPSLEEEKQLSDNCAGALARILLCEQARPRIPVPAVAAAFFAHLPLRVDLEELPAVVTAIVAMAHATDLRPYVDPLTAARVLLASLLHPKRDRLVRQLTPALEQTAVALLRTFLKSMPAAAGTALLAPYTPEQQRALGLGAV